MENEKNKAPISYLSFPEGGSSRVSSDGSGEELFNQILTDATERKPNSGRQTNLASDIRAVEGQVNAMRSRLLPAPQSGNTGDACVLDEDNRPQWQKIDGLPDTEGKTERMGLLLDAETKPQWLKIRELPDTEGKSVGMFPMLTSVSPDPVVEWVWLKWR